MTRWPPKLCAAAVSTLALVAYLNNLGNGFVYDDRFIIELNPDVQELNWGGLLGSSYWGELVSAGLYRPLTLLSFGLNRALSGAGPFGFHLVNNLLHAMVSLMVYFLLRALGAGGFVSLAAGALFAVHPVHTETVSGIVGRAEILAFLFVLGAMGLVIINRRQPGARGGLPVAVFGLVVLALLSKESAVFALPLFLLYDASVAGRLRARTYLPLVAAIVVCSLV